MLRIAATLSHKGRGKGDRSRLFLPQFDLVGDLIGEADAAEGQDDFGGQLFVALEAAGRDRALLFRFRAAK
jgi:hypothetical protein